MTLGNDKVSIEIHDNGKGMTKETLGKIFDPFFTTKAVGEGMGMGLSISYRIIQDHHGDIKVSSKQGGGSIFKIILPVEDVEAEYSG